MDVALVISRFGGIATRAQLMAAGCSGGDITRSVRLGQVRRLRRAHYSSIEARFDALVAVRVGGRLAGVSAAASHGLWSGRDPRIHVAVPSNGGRLRTHAPLSSSGSRSADLFDAEVVLHWVDSESNRECWRTTKMQTLLNVAEWEDAETAIACLDTALTIGVDRDALMRVATNSPPRVRARIAAARPGSESGLESIVRQRLTASGHRVEQQVAIADVGRVDMIINGRLVVEVDGFAFHGDREAFERDRARDAELVARGRPVIRLSAARILDDWPECERQIRAALAFASPFSGAEVRRSPQRGTGPVGGHSSP